MAVSEDLVERQPGDGQQDRCPGPSTVTFTVKGTPRPGAQAGDRRSSPDRRAAAADRQRCDLAGHVHEIAGEGSAALAGAKRQRQGQAFETLPLLLTGRRPVW